MGLIELLGLCSLSLVFLLMYDAVVPEGLDGFNPPPLVAAFIGWTAVIGLLGSTGYGIVKLFLFLFGMKG